MEVARNDYDPDLFICVSNSRVQREGDEATTEPDEVPEATRGHNFQPLNFEERQPILHITTSSIEDPARLFQLFVPETLVNTWVTYTNTAAAAMNPEERDKKTPWYPTNLSEVYTFLAILIYIGLHKEEELEDYWRVPTPGDLIPDHPIAKFLPLCRFHQLFRLLRIYDEDRLDRTETNDPLNYQKVDDFSSCLQGACMRIWGPGSRVAVDEAIIGYTGRSKLTITIPSKPDPTGFKVWVIAEGGFFLRWLFHTPNTTFGPAAGEITRRRPQELANRSLNPTQSVVVALVNLLPTATYHVFMDNLFSSPKLYRILRQRGIAATGTARINSGINAELVEHKKQDNKGKLQWPWDYYEAIPTADNQVNQIAWKDTKLVLFLTTAYRETEFEARIRKRPTSTKPQARQVKRYFSTEAVLTVWIPSFAAEYNDEMGAVDIGDQLRAPFHYDHHIRKGSWRCLAWSFLLDIAVVNSYIIQSRQPVKWAPFEPQGRWRQALVNSLIQHYGHIAKSRKRYRSGDTFTPISQHNLIQRGKRGPCLACKGIRFDETRQNRGMRELQSGNSLRKYSAWGCDVCDVAICNSKDCWDFYHRLK